MRLAILSVCLLGCILTLSAVARAETFSSPSYTSADPVVTLHGGYAASPSFQLFGSSGPIVIGESTSTNFVYRTGFLYFPLVTAPIAVATPGNASVNLTWTAATAALGYTISGYDVGVSAADGGPYSYSNVGDVLAHTVQGLPNNSVRYFVVRANDFYGNPIATSSQVSATPVGGNNNQNNAGGGGGGGGGGGAVATTIQASGITFPSALVYLVKDGVIIATAESTAQGTFSIGQSVSPGTAVFTIYAADKNGNRTGSVSYTTDVQFGSTTKIENIVLPPLVTTDKESVKPGDIITITGRGAPNSNSVITIDEIPGLQFKVTLDSSGTFSTPFKVADLGNGAYSVRARLERNGTVTGLSQLIQFIVGNKTVDRTEQQQCSEADFNCDGKVNLIDFSILLFWFEKKNPPDAIDLNHDGKVDIIDFSILMYYWTGG